ncbi:MAG: hypothetical protein ACKO66_00235, partial [Flavobacteriales bacterium]
MTSEIDKISQFTSALITSGGCAGQIVRTYTASDVCGNTSTFIQVIQLYDATAPVLQMPDVISADVNCDILSISDVIAYQNGSMSSEEAAAFEA